MEQNVSLKPFNTFGIDIKANLFQTFDSITSLQGIVSSVKDPLLILGGGSNILFTQDFKGTVLKNEIEGIEVIDETETSITLNVGAGVVWHDFVLHCVEKNWYGVENLSLIPGTVGASPIQNIGAYGVEVKDVITKVDFLDLASNQIKTLKNSECRFDYRNSIFKNELKGSFIVTNVYFKLQKTANLNTSYGAINTVLNEKGISLPTIKDVSDTVIEIRSSKLPDPNKIGNAGSFFKNPVIEKSRYNQIKLQYPNIPCYSISDIKVKVPAGWLIEQAGWKGKTFDHIGVHKNQALVLVNYGNGKGNDIKKLAYEIKNSIKTKFGITIDPEVNIL